MSLLLTLSCLTEHTSWHHYYLSVIPWVYNWPCHAWLSTHHDIICQWHHESTTDLVMLDWAHIMTSLLSVWDTMSLLLTLSCLTKHTWWHHYCLSETLLLYYWPCHAWLSTNGDITIACLGHWVYYWPCHAWLSTNGDITIACLGHYESTTDLVMPDWAHRVTSPLPLWDTMSLLLILPCLTEHTCWHHYCLSGITNDAANIQNRIVDGPGSCKFRHSFIKYILVFLP